MYKMAVLDIDGTLVDDKGILSKKTIQTIQDVQKTGAVVTICTGRNIKKTLPIVKKAGIEVPFICIDGTILYDPIQGKVIEDLQLTQEETHFVLDIAKERNVFIEVSNGITYYKYIKNKEMLQYDIFNQHTFLGRIKSYFGGIEYFYEFERLKQLNAPYYQVVIAGDKKTVFDMKEEICNSNFGEIEVRDYLWEKYLFINRKGIKKSFGLKMLCKHFKIAMEDVVAIGDDRNDIDMIEMAGMGVAMENAVESVKEVADFITDTNNNHGAAQALEKYFLS